jgi:hypothetical protein
MERAYQGPAHLREMNSARSLELNSEATSGASRVEAGVEASGAETCVEAGVVFSGMELAVALGARRLRAMGRAAAVCGGRI